MAAAPGSEARANPTQATPDPQMGRRRARPMGQPICLKKMNQPYESVIRCSYCHNRFNSRLSRQGNAKKWCSAQCKSRGLRSAATGIPVMPKPLERKIPKSPDIRQCRKCPTRFKAGLQREFCSKKCAKSHWAAVRGRAKKARRLTALGGQHAPCEVCGVDFHTDVCHIIPAMLGGSRSPLNILRLCPNHHWKFDNSGLDLPELNALGIGFLAA